MGNHITHDNGMENFYLSSSLKKKNHLFPLSQIVWVYILALQIALSLWLSIFNVL